MEHGEVNSTLPHGNKIIATISAYSYSGSCFWHMNMRKVGLPSPHKTCQVRPGQKYQRRMGEECGQTNQGSRRCHFAYVHGCRPGMESHFNQHTGQQVKLFIQVQSKEVFKYCSVAVRKSVGVGEGKRASAQVIWKITACEYYGNFYATKCKKKKMDACDRTWTLFVVFVDAFGWHNSDGHGLGIERFFLWVIGWWGGSPQYGVWRKEGSAKRESRSEFRCLLLFALFLKKQRQKSILTSLLFSIAIAIANSGMCYRMQRKGWVLYLVFALLWSPH